MEMNEINDITNFLFKKKITTHIDTKGGEFYNGLIIEVHETFIVMNDRILGETPITISEIDTIEKFRSVGK